MSDQNSPAPVTPPPANAGEHQSQPMPAVPSPVAVSVVVGAPLWLHGGNVAPAAAQDVPGQETPRGQGSLVLGGLILAAIAAIAIAIASPWLTPLLQLVVQGAGYLLIAAAVFLVGTIALLVLLS